MTNGKTSETLISKGRAEMFVLPAALRGSTHFGDDLEDGSPESEELLRQENAFTGPPGTMVLFDGSQGIHRGGLVRNGQRWVVQIGMAPRGDTQPAPYNRLRFLKHSVGNLLRLSGLRK